MWKKSKKEGHACYSSKPSKGHGGTWSKEEYHSLGLQHQYLRFKSIQRFTEMYSFLERAFAFKELREVETMKTVRILSLGGGPGFELYACEVYFKEMFPNVKCELTSLDLEGGWKPYAELLHCKFIEGDFLDPRVIDHAGKNYDYVILSYVLFHHLQDHIHRVVDLVTKSDYGVKAVFVNSRFENLDIFDHLEENGVILTRLMDPKLGRDDRQTILTRRPNVELTFPNVPYEEHKKPNKSNNNFGSEQQKKYRDQKFGNSPPYQKPEKIASRQYKYYESRNSKRTAEESNIQRPTDTSKKQRQDHTSTHQPNLRDKS